jgi:hypothetical protein
VNSISNHYTRRILPDIQHPVPNLEISYSKSIYTNVKYNSDFACAFTGVKPGLALQEAHRLGKLEKTA